MQFPEPVHTADARDSAVDRTGPEAACVCVCVCVTHDAFAGELCDASPLIASEVVNEDVLAGLLSVAL